MKTQEEILEGLKLQDSKAIKAVYEGSYPTVNKLVLSNSGTEADAEDVFAEAVMVLFKYLQREDFKLTAPLNRFLYAISRNIWYRQLRNQKKRNISISELSEREIEEAVYTDGKNIFSEIDAQKRETILLQSLEELPASCRKLLTEYYFQERTLSEIAENLGISYHHLRQRLFQCRKSLQKIVLLKTDESTPEL